MPQASGPAGPWQLRLCSRTPTPVPHCAVQAPALRLRRPQGLPWAVKDRSLGSASRLQLGLASELVCVVSQESLC